MEYDLVNDRKERAKIETDAEGLFIKNAKLVPVVMTVTNISLDQLRGATVGYILNHGSLSKQPYRGDSEKDNIPGFKEDLKNGVLDMFKESYGYALYHKGVLCGIGHDGARLLENAQNYYGKSDLAMFKIPENPETIDDVLAIASGEF